MVSRVARQRRIDIRALDTARRMRAEAFAWLGALLLAINLLAATQPVMPLQLTLADGLSGAIEICTPDGMVRIDADGHRLPAGSPAHDGGLCQFCLPLLHGSFTLSAPPPLPLPRVIAVAEAAMPAMASAAPAVIRRPGQPRAPPIV